MQYPSCNKIHSQARGKSVPAAITKRRQKEESNAKKKTNLKSFREEIGINYDLANCEKKT